MRSFRHSLRASLVAALVLCLSACGGGGGGPEASEDESPPPAEQPTVLPALLDQLPAGGLQRWLAGHPGNSVPEPVHTRAEAFFEAQAAYFAGDYTRAKTLLDAVWSRFPIGNPSWLADNGPPLSRTLPGLRMLNDATAWRLRQQASGKPLRPHPLMLTVVLPTTAVGNRPETLSELQQETGAQATYALDRQLLEEKARALREALWLYGEYLLASTEGRLQLQLQVQTVELPARVRVGPAAGVANTGQVNIDNPWALIAATPLDVQRNTDQWWVIYPSAVPSAKELRDTLWFITGGMKSYSQSPMFVSDDAGLLYRSGDHVAYAAGAPMSTEDRLIYFPEWLHGELFHHLALTYPELQLEPTPDVWLDRSLWPTDFVGLTDIDYFHEAMQRRVLTAPDGSHELARRLWHKNPGPAFLAGLRPADLAGRYEVPDADPSNAWLRGNIEVHPDAAKPGRPPLQWHNDAGRVWNLYPELTEDGVLQSSALGTDATNPYLNLGRPTMDLVLKLDLDEPARTTVRGLRFVERFERR